MTLEELTHEWERRATDGDRINSMAPVKDLWRLAISELQETDSTPTVERKDRLISVAEAAERLSVSKRYIYARKDSLPYVRHSGGMVRCSEFAVERQIKTLRLAS